MKKAFTVSEDLIQEVKNEMLTLEHYINVCYTVSESKGVGKYKVNTFGGWVSIDKPSDDAYMITWMNQKTRHKPFWNMCLDKKPAGSIIVMKDGSAIFTQSKGGKMIRIEDLSKALKFTKIMYNRLRESIA